jgi:transcriptional regulator with XRE-family HTH domain
MPDRTNQLVYELHAWYRSHAVRQKDLADSLAMSPQQLSEVLSLRNRPTVEQILRIQEFLRTDNMKAIVDPPAIPRASTRDPNDPRTLHEAKGMIEALRAQLKGGTALTTKAQSAGPAHPAPPISMSSATRPNAVPMPVNRARPKKALPPEANTPVLIQRILDVTELDDLRLMLDNPVHTPIQQAAIYKEVKARRSLVANRFQ